MAALALALAASGCSQNQDDTQPAADLCSATASPPVVDPSDHPIAFSPTRAGSADLWLMTDDGSDPVQLTTQAGDELAASWSPDGNRLAFTAIAISGDEGPGDICIVNSDGTGLLNLTRTQEVSEGAPSWSPDGRSIAYMVENNDLARIYIMNSDGTQQRQLSDVSGYWPDWSPDGSRILYTSTESSRYEQLWVIDHDGRNRSQLTTDESLGSAQPAWSPDGSSIAFASSRDGNPEATDPVEWNEEIYIMSTDGSDVTRVTTTQGNDHWPPTWSPDSQRLAFKADGPQEVGEIVLADLRTARLTNLTRHDAHDLFPAWRS